MHTRKALVSKASLAMILIFLISVFNIIPIARAETAEIFVSITLGSTGWSDSSAGTWDPLTRIGTLTRDIYGTIEIISDSITLDGAGHSIRGNGTDNGVYSESNHYLTIRNLQVTECRNGILLAWSNYNTVTDNSLTDNDNANLFLSRSEYNIVTGNLMADSLYCGILLREFANNNTIRGNTFTGNQTGISLQGAQRNLVIYNTVQGNTAAGIFISDSPTNIYNIPSTQNQIYRNNFIDNYSHAYIFNYVFNTDNRFFRNIPDGGNYWSGHVSGDSNLDGIADTPFVFTGSQDNLPWTAPDGWESSAGDPPAAPSYLYVYLSNDGWSEPVGTWDQSSRTAALTQDITGTIAVITNSVILDGNGYTVLGDGNGVGIQVAMHGYITIRNIKANNHRYGFSLSYAYDSTIENCIVTNSEYGYYLLESRRNQLLGNKSLNNTYGISLSTLSDNNTVNGNLIDNSNYGLDLPGAFDNVITENTIRDSSVSGISIRLQPYTSSSILHANRNQVYHNDFINNTTQATVYAEGTANIFNLDAPVGGNYWSSHISADANQDGFADSPYAFSGGQDNLPLMVSFGWHPVIDDPPGNEDYISAVSEILVAFDQAILDEAILGNEDPEKLTEFRDKLIEVQDKLTAGEMRAAYQLLKTVYSFIDGQSKPKDLVTGPSAVGLSNNILQLLSLIEP